MKILGIDPGTATTGYAIIEKKNNIFRALDFGIISTKAGRPAPERLLVLQKDIRALVKKHKPDCAGVEKLYFEKNAKTAMAVSEARGVILASLEDLKIPIHEFTPLQVKSIICGYGKADKKQVEYMVKQMFNLKRAPKPDDASDALAIATCAGLKNK